MHLVIHSVRVWIFLFLWICFRFFFLLSCYYLLCECKDVVFSQDALEILCRYLCCFCTSSKFHVHDIFCISCVPVEQQTKTEQKHKLTTSEKFCFLFLYSFSRYPAVPFSLSLSHVRTIRLSTCLPWLHALQHILLRFRQFILFNFILFRERVFFLSICFFVSLLLLLQAAAAAAVACLTRDNSTDMVFMCLFYTSTLAAALYVAFARMHFVLNVV